MTVEDLANLEEGKSLYDQIQVLGEQITDVTNNYDFAFVRATHSSSGRNQDFSFEDDGDVQAEFKTLLITKLTAQKTALEAQFAAL